MLSQCVGRTVVTNHHQQQQTSQQQYTSIGRQMQTAGQPRLPCISPAEETLGQRGQQQQQQPYQLFGYLVDMNKMKRKFIKLEMEYETEQFIEARCKVRMSLLTKYFSMCTII